MKAIYVHKILKAQLVSIMLISEKHDNYIYLLIYYVHEQIMVNCTQLVINGLNKTLISDK